MIAVVPLSSRFDVARAIDAARDAARGAWASPELRGELLRALLDRLDRARPELAAAQCVESGLSRPDSLSTIDATLAAARASMRSPAATGPATGGVSGHILSWGLPFTEVLASTLGPLGRGDAVVVKPSLRAPLAPVAFATLASEVGIPPGVVNIVQGTGVDVGAALIAARELSTLYVRAGEPTLAQAGRGHQRTGVTIRTLRGGGNVVIVESAASVADAVDPVAAGLRVHSCGGPFGLPLLAVHRDRWKPVLTAVLDRLTGLVPAPLPTEPLRQRALARIRSLVEAGAEVPHGGVDLPDDIEHRMGWRIPPTVLMLGPTDTTAARVERATVPIGPVLSVVTWTTRAELDRFLTAPRHADGVTRLIGTGPGDGVTVPAAWWA